MPRLRRGRQRSSGACRSARRPTTSRAARLRKDVLPSTCTAPPATRSASARTRTAASGRSNPTVRPTRSPRPCRWAPRSACSTQPGRPTDDTRFISGAVGHQVRLASTCRSDLDNSYWNPSGDQNKPGDGRLRRARPGDRRSHRRGRCRRTSTATWCSRRRSSTSRASPVCAPADGDDRRGLHAGRHQRRSRSRSSRSRSCRNSFNDGETGVSAQRPDQLLAQRAARPGDARRDPRSARPPPGTVTVTRADGAPASTSASARPLDRQHRVHDDDPRDDHGHVLGQPLPQAKSYHLHHRRVALGAIPHEANAICSSRRRSGPPACSPTSSIRPPRARSRRRRGAIQGVVTDGETGEKLAGVTVIVTSPALPQRADGDHRRERRLQDHRAPARRLPRHVLLRRHHASSAAASTSASTRRRRSTRSSNQTQAGGEVVKIDDTRADDRSDVDDAGHHDRQELHQEHPGAGPHVRVRARRRRRLAGRRRSASRSRARRSLENQYYRRRRQHDGPDVRHRRLAGHQRLHRGDRGHHRRLQRRVRPRDRRRRQRRHQERLERVQGLGVRLLAARLPDGAGRDARRSTRRRSTPPATSPTDADFGFELGGPIIKDKLWFFVGFAPRSRRSTTRAQTKRQTDCRKLGDDGKLSGCNPRHRDDGRQRRRRPGHRSGDRLLHHRRRSTREIRTRHAPGLQLLGKINYAATPGAPGPALAPGAAAARAAGPGIYGPRRARLQGAAR